MPKKPAAKPSSTRPRSLPPRPASGSTRRNRQSADTTVNRADPTTGHLDHVQDIDGSNTRPSARGRPSLRVGPIQQKSHSAARSRSRSTSPSRTRRHSPSARASGARIDHHPVTQHAPADGLSPEAAERAHQSVLASHLAFTQIQLPTKLQPTTSVTSTVQPTPFSHLHSPLLGAYSTYGERHGSSDRCEDACITFDLTFQPDRIPATSSGGGGVVTNLPSSNTRFRVAAVLDGHGVDAAMPKRRHGRQGAVSASPGALLVALAAQLLPEFMNRLIHLDRDLLQSTRCIYNDGNDQQGQANQRGYNDSLHHALCHFRDLFNAYLFARRPAAVPTMVLDDAGCTVCLALHFASPSDRTPAVFAINIGDSSMLLLDPTVGTLLPAWSTAAIAQPHCPLQAAARARFTNPSQPSPATTHLTAAYQDSVAAYPQGVEGQDPDLLAQDMDMVQANVRTKHSRGTRATHPDWVLGAPGTVHRLRMTNAVGNLGHHRTGAFVPRTTVYRVDRAPAGIPHEAVLVLMTDGVRDVVKDSGTLVAVAGALREGPAACARVVDRWVAAVNQHMRKMGSRTRVSAGAETPGKPRLVAQLSQLAHVFSPTHHQASPRALAAAHRLAHLFSMEEAPKEDEYSELLAECLVQVAVMRGTVDDATCLVWKVGKKQQALAGQLAHNWWAVSAVALDALRTEE